MNCRSFAGLSVVALLLAAGAIASGAGAAEREVKFKKTQLDTKFRSEGSAVGDFNHDGKMDISAGSVYYAAPDWHMVSVLDQPKEFDPHGYSDTFCNFADDVNGDGRTDLLVVGFPGQQTWWYEQPEKEGQPWAKHEIVGVTNNESPSFVEVAGKGRSLLLGFEPGRYIGFAKPAADKNAVWEFKAVSATNAPGTDKFSHGIGSGDVNGDGRNDILVTEGWWEQPADANQSEWTFHKANFGPACAQMFAYDFDGDGDSDVLTSSAHGFGIWWHEQTKEGWQTHEIDKSFSQTHGLCLADINGDKLPDFVTGKRWWAHGPGGDPGSDQPAVMFWFELERKDGKANWIAHKFDDDSGVGTQFEVADVNGDGLLDVVTANKKGANYFEQQK